MAGSSLLALIDDIASILDDVALMSKVAAKKTAGVLGDDLALNAYQVSGVHADRELAVVWAVAKGSLKNKAILVPAALAISFLIPWAIKPVLMIGGAYLCYEGFEKIAHKFMQDADENAHHSEHLEALAHSATDLLGIEKEKIQGAIRSDRQAIGIIDLSLRAWSAVSGKTGRAGAGDRSSRRLRGLPIPGYAL